jgi:replicative DNA helicase
MNNGAVNERACGRRALANRQCGTGSRASRGIASRTRAHRSGCRQDRPEHFFEPLHGRIFAAICKLHNEGKIANPVTLKPLFDDDPGMKEVGGASYLVTIMGNGVAVIGARDFASDTRALAEKRKLIASLTETIIDGRKADVSPAELVSSVEQAIAGVTEQSDAAIQITAADAVKRVLDGFGKRESGISSGIRPIDEGLGALLPKQLVIVAGRPSMGKSAIASSYALGAASAGHGTLFVSLEMSAEELGERIAADMCFDTSCQVPYSAITDGRVTPEQGRQIARAYERLADIPLGIVDLASCSISKLNSIVRRHARRMAAKGKKLELVIVDYLGHQAAIEIEQKVREDADAVASAISSLAERARAAGVAGETQH